MSAMPTHKRNREQTADSQQRSVRTKHSDQPPGAKHFKLNSNSFGSSSKNSESLSKHEKILRMLHQQQHADKNPSEEFQALQKQVKESLHHKELYKQAAESLNVELEDTKTTLDKERFELRKANSKISSLYSRLEIKDQQILDLKAIEQDARIERQGWLSRIEHVEEQLDLFEKKHTELDESNTHLQKMFEELGDTNEQLRTEVEFLERRNNHLQKIAMDREALIKELRAKVSESKGEDEKDAQINTLTMLVNKQNTTLKEACGNLIDPITAELSSNLVLLESGQPISLEGIVTIWMNMENFSGDPYSAIPCPTTRLLVGPVKDQVSSNFINRIAESLSTDPDVDTKGVFYIKYRYPGSTIWQIYPVADQIQILSKLVFAHKQLLKHQPSSFLIQIKGNHLITINGNVDTDIIRIGLRIFDIDSGIMTPCAIYLCGQDALFGGTQVSPVH